MRLKEAERESLELQEPPRLAMATIKRAIIQLQNLKLNENNKDRLTTTFWEKKCK